MRRTRGEGLMATPIPANHADVRARPKLRPRRRGVVRRAGRRRARAGSSRTARAVAGGEAFVALRGETHDGHAFLDEAARRGAALVVVERGCRRRRGPTSSRSSDTLVAWGDLARAHLRAWRAAREDARVVAITGSAGKTTTKQLCAALLDARRPQRVGIAGKSEQPRRRARGRLRARRVASIRRHRDGDERARRDRATRSDREPGRRA